MNLRHLWYFGGPGERLKPGQVTGRLLLDEPILVGRGHDGKVFAFRDICPHRGVPLSAGAVKGGQGKTTEVECPYHGWRFGPNGRCTAIPSLTKDQHLNIDRIRVKSYPAVEEFGNIWIYMGDPDPLKFDPEAEPHSPPPKLPINDMRPKFRESMIFSCDVDHAVIGLMDPAHGPYVHRSWWWRTEGSMHEKAKAFSPSHLGFTMRSHKPSTNSFAYKILGGEVSTEIAFQLPGIRTEHIKAGKHTILGLTTVTPIEENKTEVMQTFYWDTPILSVLRPLLKPAAVEFLRQDRDIVDLQQVGLRHQPNLMLINDADVQAKWYFNLKKEWSDALDEARTFANPVEETVLHWTS